MKVLFKVGLVFLRHALGSKERLNDCGRMYETMEQLHSLLLQRMPEDFLVSEVISLRFPVHRSIGRRGRSGSNDLQYRPSCQLYGARAILEEVTHLKPPLDASPSLRNPTASLANLRVAPSRGAPSPASSFPSTIRHPEL